MAGIRAELEKVANPAVESKKEALEMSKHEISHETGTDVESTPVVSTSENLKPEYAPIPEIEGIKTAISQMEALTGRIVGLVHEIQDFDKNTADSILKIKNKAINEPEYALLLNLNPDWENNLKKGVESKRKAITSEIEQFVPYYRSIAELALNLRRKYGIEPITVAVSDTKGSTGTKSGKKAGNRVWSADIAKLSPESITKHEIRAERESGEDYLRVYFNGSEKGTVFKSNLPKGVIDEMNA